MARLFKSFAPDIVRNRSYLFLERTYVYWHLILAVALALTGWLIGGGYLAVSLLAYGFFLRMVVVLHGSWLVNSLSHCRGYRSYETGDASRNNAFVAAVAHGEGWHNNHHHAQRAANHGHRRWEFDLSYLCIVTLACISSGRNRSRPDQE